jgi:NitT/TauT family transport system ATP-binding protein
VTESQFITFQDVTKVFEGAAGDDIEVVEPLSLTIARGEFVVFVGPSGCGKTTVMRMVGGLETPSTGMISLNGKPVRAPSREKGMVFQSYSSFPWLTVFGNVRFGLKYRRDVTAAEKDRIARHYLEVVGLTPFADFYVNRISGGMRQRVAIARTLAADPLALLMDEPFRGARRADPRAAAAAAARTAEGGAQDGDLRHPRRRRSGAAGGSHHRLFGPAGTCAARHPGGGELPPERDFEISENPAFRRLRHEVLGLLRSEEERAEQAGTGGRIMSGVQRKPSISRVSACW